ncbi:Citrate synthase [Phytophthora nicotianae]|uniref:Citrate synthase n=1 Tax=Phytophthora nicotianae TaxID=4792 RepID=A0A0W8DHK7_PHYNI|nr:Citrate synthase [Phytophthora nicotianae]
MLRLDEALAFIAFCEERIHDPVSADNLHGTRASILLEEIDDLLDPEVQGSVSAESIKTSSTSHNLSLIGIPSATPARQKKRIRSAGSSSAVLQRRKKAEIESLREESKTLETYLSHLRRTGGPEKPMAITNGDELRSEWQRHAFIQYQQRYASEQTNRHLKELLSKQQRLSRKLRRNLFKRNALDVSIWFYDFVVIITAH